MERGDNVMLDLDFLVDDVVLPPVEAEVKVEAKMKAKVEVKVEAKVEVPIMVPAPAPAPIIAPLVPVPRLKIKQIRTGGFGYQVFTVNGPTKAFRPDQYEDFVAYCATFKN